LGEGGVAVDSLQKTAETAETAEMAEMAAGAAGAAEAGATGRGRPFTKGQSGNPRGRPRGSRNTAARIAQLLLEGEAEALARKAIERALAGDGLALKLCLDRLLAPQRRRPVELELPELREASGLAGAMAAVGAAAARGEITPSEAFELAQVVDVALRAHKTAELERRRKSFWGGGKAGAGEGEG
jgi:Family of unknown function (DUF5681)